MAIAVAPNRGTARINDLVALSRTRPVTIGTSGLGGPLHLLIEALGKATGGNFTMVTYRGTGPTVTDTMGGALDATVADVGAFIPLHNDSKLLIIGVATEFERYGRLIRDAGIVVERLARISRQTAR